MKAHMLFPLMLALPAPVLAGSFTPPAGCTTFLTVQAKGCRVSNHYTCQADAPGDQWRADFDLDGIFFMSRINAEAEWVESYNFNPTVKQWLEPGATDPASFSGLLATGLDTFAFHLSDETGAQSEVRGFDRMTGRSVTIDGVALQETEFEFSETAPDGTVLNQSRGHEYVSPDWRLFFAGPSEWNGGDGTFVPYDGSPIQFILPGEGGFASTQPLFDCDPMMTQAEPGDAHLVPAVSK